MKCGILMNCSKGADNWTEAEAKVTRPCNCVIGCHTCANPCLGDAISFPDIQEIPVLYKPESIRQHVKKELQGAGKLIINER